METSDSECFESADEEIISDSEETSKRPILKTTQEIRSHEKTDNCNVEGEKIEKRKPTKTLGAKIKKHTTTTSTNKDVNDKENLKEIEYINTVETAKTILPCVTSQYVSKEGNVWETKTNEMESSNITKTEATKSTESNTTNKDFIQEENMWENDDWEPMTETVSKPEDTHPTVQSNQQENLSSTNWRDWGTWGVTSLLSTATMGVTTITSHVSHVLENGIGVPDPVELARADMSDKVEKTEETTIPDLTFRLGNLVSGVSQITKLVESTGTKVLSSGLDTLETIGKKTMEVLQDGDPGLKKKRAFLKIEPDKPVLSQILREAKEKVENANKVLEEKHFSKKANYELLFDDHQGLVHLEALEMLSKQCDIKLQTFLESQSGSELIEIQETMDQIKELCELSEDDDEKVCTTDEIKEKLDLGVSEMNIPISYGKLITTWGEAEEWLENLNLNVCNEMELYEQSINILAQLTAIAVELFHKIGELLLIKAHRSTADEADNLVQLTMTITTLISIAAKKIADKLNQKAQNSAYKDKISELIANVYYEATNSSSYIKNAFHLLIPVLQVGAV